ncbi:MAG: hypothetical protein K1X75_06800 [Leptospirales bacterium]|nr:hypothetical protein [Leptospirales bacterium]
MILRSAFLCLLVLACCARPETEAPHSNIHIGNLEPRDLYRSPEKRQLRYMRGDLIDCRDVSIDYLEGNVRGDKTRGVVINVMRGVIDGGGVTVNVLQGSIVRGDNVSVNLLLGEDLSARAKVGRRVDPSEMQQ